MDTQGDFTYEYLPWRGVSRATMSRYKVATKISSTGEPVSVGFPYPNEAVKVRLLSEKKFYASGPMSDARLFGKDVFQSGAHTITITEGELDALSVFEMIGSAAVSVRSASSARKDCEGDFEYLNSFSRIYLCFDNDEPGKKAAQEVASLFDNGKVYNVRLSKHKDANDYLTKGDIGEFKQAWQNAKRFVPDSIVSSFAEIEGILKEKRKDAIATYPFARIQEMTYGMRGGECVLIKALEGIGKTEVIRAIEYHVAKTTDYNIGIIHLEEPKDRSVRGLAGYELSQPVHLPDSNVSDEEVLSAYKTLSGRDERIHIYSHFGSDDPDVVLGTIRYLVAVCGCKLIFLDHISILVSGIESSDERQKLDYISTKFKMLAEELDFCMVFISHVNDEGQTRGSRNISKIADLVVSLHRNITADTEVERNTTTLLVEKNRFGSTTGPAGSIFFERSTFKVRDQSELDGLIPGA